MKRNLKPGVRKLRFPFLAILSILPVIGCYVYASIQHEPAERFYNVAVYALMAALSVITIVFTLAGWGNDVAARIEELEEEIERLKHTQK